MAKEILPINDVILEVKTKYHECNKCEHKSSNCRNKYRSTTRINITRPFEIYIIALDDFSISVISLCMLYIVVWI